ncbi:hypothetical protein EXIGLDRAFT_724991 [Exidia glandulosa HHB12029]|uniref:Methyltransferase domain-containing protein n=1 Tax=Exidia glandulosa HHB12029 TaxID=1314781 RepID=A0A165MN77_EXIGL|nr:hypothetical protein EXIGLDRAFT_724991 [Exidia glandulosa HHB12029]
MTIDYSSKEVWQQRFTEHPDNFEWLGGSDALLPIIQNLLSSLPIDSTILHIGCGTSNLSFAIRDGLSVSPERILNLDYAARAIELGQALEGDSKAKGKMLWTVADLLDWENLHGACKEMAPFGMILDKSTSDAIACGYDVDASIAFLPGHPTVQLEPMILLALHLAALVRPGSVWLAMSYSSTRFDFLDDVHALPGVARLNDLWTVERKEEVEAFEQVVPDAPGSTHVHRPPIMHNVYVLRRTNTPLDVWPKDDFYE